ncbi:hypothetical protein HDE_00983 [Halotydeus destructor]|nr:hypothetical protein HDE_00983 [Halotydeus destructor]
MATKVSNRFEGFKLEEITCKIAIFKDVDYGSAWMRADCIATDSIGVLAPVAGADIRIVTPILNDSANTESTVMYDSGSDEFEPFLDTFLLMDRYSYIAIFVSIFMVASMTCSEISGRSSHLHTMKLVSMKFLFALWCIFASTVGQGRPLTRTAVLNMVWLMMTIGLFIISSGYFLNLMGTEQVARRSPDQIETLNDVISHKFEHIEPTMVTNAFTYAMNKLVKRGSNEDKVFQKLRRHELNFISVDPQNNKYNRSIFELATESNCTETVTSKLNSGAVDAFGNYSGSVGMIQRAEVDYAWVWMRSDCLKSDTMGVLAPAFEAGVRIVSPILLESANTESVVKHDSGSERFEPLLDTLTVVDRCSYLGVFTAILATAVLISTSYAMRMSRPFTISRISHPFKRSLWNAFELVVQQDTSNHRKSTPRFAWLMLSMTLFVIISGLFLNLFRTEKVAKRGADQIETIYDVIGQKFIGVEPTLVTNSYTYALRSLVKPGTNEYKIFEALKRNKKNLFSLIPEPGRDEDDNIILMMYKMIEHRNRYVLFEEVQWQPLQPVLCYAHPNNARQVHTARDTILDGVLVQPYRLGLDPKLRTYITYRLRNQFELGLSSRDFYDIYYAIGLVTQQVANGRPNSTMCLLGLNDEAPVAEMQFQMGHSILFFRFLVMVLVVSALVVSLEVLLKKKRRPQKANLRVR